MRTSRKVMLIVLVTGLFLTAGSAAWADHGGRGGSDRGVSKTLWESFWEDDVMTTAEIDQLPTDHWLRGDSESLADGRITKDEYNELRQALWPCEGTRADNKSRHYWSGPKTVPTV